LALACTTNHPVSVTPDAVQLSQYLEAHPSPDLQVTDTAGQSYWLHDPVVQNDSLIGVRNRNQPDTRVGLGLGEVRSLARPEFDTESALLMTGFVAGMAVMYVTLMDDTETLVYPDVRGE